MKKSVYKKYLIKTALVWLGCFILFFFVYLTVLAPQQKSRKQIEKQLEDKKQLYELALKATKEETKIRLNEQIEQLRNRLKDFAVDFENSANLTFDISQIANTRGVNSFSIGSKESRRTLALPKCKYLYEERINVSFTAAGFNQFAALLSDLERHRPVIFVDGFKVARSSRYDVEHQMSIDLAVLVKKQQDG